MSDEPSNGLLVGQSMPKLVDSVVLFTLCDRRDCCGAHGTSSPFFSLSKRWMCSGIWASGEQCERIYLRVSILQREILIITHERDATLCEHLEERPKVVSVTSWPVSH